LFRLLDKHPELLRDLGQELPILLVKILELLHVVVLGRG
jgi:hypothetical protein